ncbi:MAG: glycosyltransferase family 2 protein [Microthrixaceae bacterium]
MTRPSAGDGDRSPDVTVTIVSYNCRDLVLECIDSLDAAVTPPRRLEVVVVDNDSRDGTVAAIRDAHPEVTVVDRRENAGFGRSHNLAASKATGRYVFVLNPDAVVEAGALDTLVEFCGSPGRGGEPVGVAAPQLLNADLTDQRTARSFPTMSAGLFGRRSPLTRWFPDNRWSRRFLEPERTGRADEPWKVDWVSGAAMLIPRELFGQVGGFDEDFFMHFEDTELCHRLSGLGRPVWCVPGARVVHDEGGARGGWPVSQLVAFHRGAYLFARKAYSPASSTRDDGPLRCS